MSGRVVIADDDPDIRELVRISAAKAGLTVVADVEDGAAAWEAIRNDVPDLAILDVAMPGLAGVDVCRLVRAVDALATVHIILLSAAADEPSRQRGIDAGADAYLIKPFSPRDLVARLTRFREGGR
ncbi:MAG: response regulator [Actinomycetota bacterium]|nr:response regulator [Actinomycetota bacterium]